MNEEYIGITTLLKELDHAFHADLICKQDVINLIINLPTTRVVDVVRCEDCKFWSDNNGGYPNEECRWAHDETPYADDFCSYGKPKEDAEVPKCHIQCPFGGDETNDCADCAYSEDFHFVKGECIRRDFNDNPEFLEGGKEE